MVECDPKLRLRHAKADHRKVEKRNSIVKLIQQKLLPIQAIFGCSWCMLHNENYFVRGRCRAPLTPLQAAAIPLALRSRIGNSVVVATSCSGASTVMSSAIASPICVACLVLLRPSYRCYCCCSLLSRSRLNRARTSCR